MPNRYFVSGGVDNNWGTTGNWSLTSNGAGGQTVPTASDDVFLDASSPNCTVNTTGRVCKTITFTGYTNTITMTQNITVSGNVTLGSSMNISGSGSLIINAASTITSNGKTWPNNINFSAVSATHSIADNWTVGSLTLSGASMAIVGLFTIFNNGGLSVTSSGSGCGGTVTLVMQGTGTWSGTGRLRIDTSINTSGTITVSGTVRFDTKTFTYVAGTVITTGSTLAPLSDCTFNTNGGTSSGLTTTSSTGINWNILSLAGGGSSTITITLLSPLTAIGNLFLCTTSGQDLAVNGSAIYAHANVSMPGNSCQGTSEIIMIGTGLLSTTGTLFRGIYNDLTIDTSGTITFGSSIEYRSGTFTYVSGTVVTTGSTFKIGASTTLNTGGINFENLSFSILSGTIITINSPIVVNSTLSVVANVGTINWAGPYGFSTSVLSSSSPGVTWNLLAGNTYSVSATASLISKIGSKITLKSSITNGTKAIFILDNNANQDFSFVNATDISSAGGQTIYTRKGTLTRTENWANLLPPVTWARTFSTT